MYNMEPPSLQTRRLLLRPIEDSDIPALFALGSDPDVSRFTLWDTFREWEDAWAYLHSVRQRHLDGSAIEWGVAYSGVLVGTVGLYSIPTAAAPERRADLGYALRRTWWGHGFASEAAQEAVSFGLRSLHLSAIYASVVLENPASTKVLTKSDFVETGVPPSALHLKGQTLSLHSYVRRALEQESLE